MIAESVPAERRARYAAYVQVGAPLGGLLAAVLGGYLEPRLGWRAVFEISAVPAFIVAIAVWRWMPESDVWRHHAAGRWLDRAELRRLRDYQRIVALLFVILLVNSEAYWFTYSWMPTYLRNARSLGAEASSALMIRMQIGGIIGYAVFGWLADRYGRRPMLSLFGVLMALGVLPPTILWAWASRIPSMLGAALFIAGIGTGLWSGVGPMIAELLPTKVRNASLGLLLNVTRGIQFFTPLAIIWMSPRIGFAATLALGALFSAVGAGLVWLLPETRGRAITALDASVAS